MYFSFFSLPLSLTLCVSDTLEPHADLEGDAPDGSFANRNGRHTIGHVDDFSALQQQVMEGRGLVQRMEATLNTCLNTALMEISTGKVSVQIQPISFSKAIVAR